MIVFIKGGGVVVVRAFISLWACRTPVGYEARGVGGPRPMTYFPSRRVLMTVFKEEGTGTEHAFQTINIHEQDRDNLKIVYWALPAPIPYPIIPVVHI